MPFNFPNNFLARNGLYALAMARAFARFRDPRRRAIWWHRVEFYEKAWREAAQEVGASFTMLGSDIHQIALGEFCTRVTENTCAIDDPVTLAVVSDKPLTYRILATQSLPVARHAGFSFKNLKPALEFIAEIDGECVIKPATGTGGGRGVTTGVRTVWQLGRAAAAAAVYGDTLLIEEQIGGDNYRLLYLDGELLDAFVRKPPTVIGDGRSTVARLLHAQNSDRLRHGSGQSQALLSIDLDMRRTLAKQKLSLRSVPARGMEVVLKTVVNDNCGIDNSNAARLLCPSIVEDAAKAVRALQIRLAGVDVITADPTVPLAKSGGAILEVNAPPNFYYHYHKSDGACPVAVHVLRRLMKCESVHPLAQSKPLASRYEAAE